MIIKEKVNIKVETNNLDEVIEKIEKLNALLKEAKALIKELNDMQIGIKVTDSFQH